MAKLPIIPDCDICVTKSSHESQKELYGVLKACVGRAYGKRDAIQGDESATQSQKGRKAPELLYNLEPSSGSRSSFYISTSF